ncbi:hypothetical protein BRC76_01460 [Halobacteriales archaeon QH_8_67_36]|nr:MAG: hypothetical protein BRC76_01460 [Halobacteriales archaeon QH_8_67_36]
MGQIINVDGGDETLPEALTQTVKSGHWSGEYLADRPAIDAVSDDETVQFVVTNRKQGIAIRNGTTRHVIPDSRYRTVVVVTDQRVIGLVGKIGGDRQLTLDISEITDVAATTNVRTCELAIDRADAPTWTVRTEADGLGEVADYLRDRSEACRSRGRGQAAGQSIRGLFETTVGSAKSFERDQVAELIPAMDDSARGRAETGPGDTSDTGEAGSRESNTDRPDKPDGETAIDDVLQALAKTDWRARGAEPKSPFDLLAEREDELVGVVVDCPSDGRIDRPTIEHCDAITGAAGTDTVMLATTGTVRNVDARLAADLGVRLRNVATMSDTTDPPVVEAVTEMVSKVLSGHRRPQPRRRNRQEQYRTLRRRHWRRRHGHGAACDDGHGAGRRRATGRGARGSTRQVGLARPPPRDRDRRRVRRRGISGPPVAWRSP